MLTKAPEFLFQLAFELRFVDVFLQLNKLPELENCRVLIRQFSFDFTNTLRFSKPRVGLKNVEELLPKALISRSDVKVETDGINVCFLTDNKLKHQHAVIFSPVATLLQGMPKP